MRSHMVALTLLLPADACCTPHAPHHHQSHAKAQSKHALTAPCPLPSAPAASNPNRDAFCASCICAVGDAIVTGLQEQGLSLETLAAQAQQEAAGRDLTTLARQVLAACQLPVALRVVATSNVDSSSFNVLQTCDAEAVAQTCNFARQINDTVSRVAGGSLPAVGAANTTSLLPSNLTSPANAKVANVTGSSGSMGGPGVSTPLEDPSAVEGPAGEGPAPALHAYDPLCAVLRTQGAHDVPCVYWLCMRMSSKGYYTCQGVITSAESWWWWLCRHQHSCGRAGSQAHTSSASSSKQQQRSFSPGCQDNFWCCASCSAALLVDSTAQAQSWAHIQCTCYNGPR
jgi:hypothetical protein